MSIFACEKCGAICQDSERGYVTGCEHYPPDIKEGRDMSNEQKPIGDERPLEALSLRVLKHHPSVMYRDEDDWEHLDDRVLYSEIAALEQRLAAAEAEKQRIVEMFIKEMCIVNPHSSVVCSRGIKGCVMQHTHLQAAEADQQRAVDAALEGVVEYLRERGRTCNRESTASIKRANCNITIYSDNLSKEANKLFHYANDVESKFKGTNPLAEAQARIAELERDLAEARKDAGRYGFLRGNVPEHSTRWPRWEVRYWTGQWWETLVKDDLNKAIDAAMRQEEE